MADIAPPIDMAEARAFAEKHGIQGVVMALHIIASSRQLKIDRLEQEVDELLFALEAALVPLEEREKMLGVESEPLRLVRAAIAKHAGE